MSEKQDENITLGLFDSVTLLISAIFSFSDKEECIVKLDDTDYLKAGDIKRSEAIEYGWRYAWLENSIVKNLLLIVLTFIIPFIELYFITRGVYLVFRKTGRLYKYKKESLHRRGRNTSSYNVSGWRNVKNLIEAELTQKEKIIQISKGILMIVFGVVMAFSHHSDYGYSHDNHFKNVETIKSSASFDKFNRKEIEIYERQSNKLRLIIENKNETIYEKKHFHKIKLKNKNSRKGYVLNNKLLREQN